MEQEYLGLLQEVLQNGTKKMDRTGTGTLSVFGHQIRCGLNEGFPLITTKRVFWKGVVAELLWFLKGSTNVKELQAQGVHIWDEWAKEDGELGPIYGKQWRQWNFMKYGEYHVEYGGYIDQIAKVIETLKTNPDSRRMLVSAWNVGELSQMALEPCHSFFQLYVKPAWECRYCVDGTVLKTVELLGSTTTESPCPICNGAGMFKPRLSLQMYQRSADLFLGVPFNIASYALLTHLIAQVVGMDVGELVITFGDAHIYLNHLDQVKLQLERKPKPLPHLKLNPSIKDIDGFRLDDIQLNGYAPHPTIKAPIAI